mmetsp:Transcript_24636/g.79285  ORF Transcript_24636/g.79285 Transcript_24636/m.79285 type:complete len:228 (-) Transcript_24636:1329-2012(-)
MALREVQGSALVRMTLLASLQPLATPVDVPSCRLPHRCSGHRPFPHLRPHPRRVQQCKRTPRLAHLGMPPLPQATVRHFATALRGAIQQRCCAAKRGGWVRMQRWRRLLPHRTCQIARSVLVGRRRARARADATRTRTTTRPSAAAWTRQHSLAAAPRQKRRRKTRGRTRSCVKRCRLALAPRASPRSRGLPRPRLAGACLASQGAFRSNVRPHPRPHPRTQPSWEL